MTKIACTPEGIAELTNLASSLMAAQEDIKTKSAAAISFIEDHEEGLDPKAGQLAACVRAIASSVDGSAESVPVIAKKLLLLARSYGEIIQKANNMPKPKGRSR